MWILAMTSVLAPGQEIEVAQYETRVQCLEAGKLMLTAAMEASKTSIPNHQGGWSGPGISCKESPAAD
ncbi:hypothetical protein BVH03_09385 [Pseudomonas sp. PA15(2017)]|nr:hypothetical protein BVH03_09385 [Pseudomonas sp. PA15(2017)]